MSTITLLMVVIISWSTVGFVVALFLGRLFRDARPAVEESSDRLIC